jgi:hypothetical protein
MARATLTTVQSIIYENLGITDKTAGYGNLLVNERYPSDYIDDSITQADLTVVTLLFKNKQDQLLKELHITADLNNKSPIPQNWGVVSVEGFDNLLGTRKTRCIEVEDDTFNQLELGGIFDTTTYSNYYCIQDGKLRLINAFDTATVTYIDFYFASSPLSSLLSPSGFEVAVANLASAILLTKRNDNPEQAKAHFELYRLFMSDYVLPENNVPEMGDLQK